MTKTMYMHFRKALVGFLLAVVMSSCGAEDICLSYQHNVQVGLYSSRSVADKDTLLTEVSVWGVGKSDTLLYRNQSVSGLFLNLNLNDSVTAYVIQTRTLKDTLEFTYRKQLEAVSGSCGPAFHITLEAVRHSNLFIDSVSLAHPSIRYNENLENVKIYIY